MSNVFERFDNAIKKGVNPNRRGVCTPNNCETLSGIKGAACCKMEGHCTFCVNDRCGIYSLRPINCNVFPARPEDLRLVRNCGYYFEGPAIMTNEF
jgi:Fe-S-cluster containining protein